MSVTELQAKAAAAKKAYKANKDDKSLKKAYKEIKAELEAAEAAAASGSNKRKAEDSEEEQKPAKKAKTVDVNALQEAADAAKKAYKANKEDKSLKAAYKAAKQAVEDAKAAPAATEEATPAKEDDSLAGLKKNNASSAAAAPASNANEKCFIGNLSWDIDDAGITEFFKDCGTPTDIHWLMDRNSDPPRFKGCGFITFENLEQSAKAMELNGTELMGRPIKMDYAKPRPGGDKKFNNKAQGFVSKPLSDKPEGCTTVFAGNLSFQIDEDAMHEFAKDCGEISSIRWLTDRDTGDFKGCGFVEFSSTEAVDQFVKLNGTSLLGRPVRLDYAGARPAKKEW